MVRTLVGASSPAVLFLGAMLDAIGGAVLGAQLYRPMCIDFCERASPEKPMIALATAVGLVIGLGIGFVLRRRFPRLR